MIKDDYKRAVMDFKLGFERGGREINKSYSALASKSLREGDGKLMAKYNRNNRILDDIRAEIEESLLTETEPMRKIK